jgi:polyisoprenyl-phosphate glycosyltransferase
MSGVEHGEGGGPWGNQGFPHAESPLLSVVVPVYNEAEIVDELVRRLHSALAGAGRYELVFVDDSSSDGSWERLAELAATDPHMRLLRLSRNFGHQVALTAGLDAARGDAIVTMDGDLQDPPEVIPALVARWQEGYDVVYAVRTEREGEGLFKRGTAAGFYWVLKKVAPIEIPAQAGDFRLLSRRAARALAQMPERARFLRGMSSWIGYRQIGVPYRRDARYAGETKYPARKMLRFATDAITSFSSAPLRLVSGIGLVFVVFCAGYLAYTVYVKAFTNQAVQGWTTVVVLVLLLGGVQLVSLGIVGTYIARIFDESKGRPLYLVDEVLEGGRVETVQEPELR